MRVSEAIQQSGVTDANIRATCPQCAKELRGNTIIASLPGDWSYFRYVDAAKVMVVSHSGHNEDGCPTEYKAVDPMP